MRDSDYYPHGTEKLVSGSVDDPHKFTGIYLDSESGLYYPWFRMYSPNLGRWLAPDPVAGDTSDPGSLNRYTYVLNNPVNFVDPLGLYEGPPDPPHPIPPMPPGGPGTFPSPWGNCSPTFAMMHPELCAPVPGDPGEVTPQPVAPGCTPSGCSGQGGSGGSGNKAPLSQKDQERYDKLKAQALSDIMNPDCLSFLILHGIDPTMLQVTLLYQRSYNGSESTITKSEAMVGIPGRGDTVAQGFRNNPGVRAAASLNGTDAYFRKGGFLSRFFGNGNIQESTIEHEALHNLLTVGDSEPGGLQERLRLTPNPSDTSNINSELKEHHCTH